MKILIYSLVFPPALGGMERFAEDLAEWLAESGHDVVVLTQTPGTGDQARPYAVLRTPSTLETAREIRAADVVHINGCSVRGIGSAVLQRRPVVTHTGHQAICPTGMAWSPKGQCSAGPRLGPCEVCPERGLVGRLDVALHTAVTKFAGANVAVSDYLFRRLGLEKARRIYNPVARRSFGTASSWEQGEDGLVVFVGRLVAEKGLDLLLGGLRLLSDARLEVVGDGPMRGKWETLTENLGLSQRVKFVGRMEFDGVAEACLRASVVCVPSIWDEPFGYAAAEAMALRRAVVGTPSGALTELLSAGRGFLAKDVSAQALAIALEHSLGDKAARRQASESAFDFAVRELASDVVGAQYVDTYQKVSA